MLSPLGSPTLRAHTLIQQNISSIKDRLETVRSEAVTGRAANIAEAVDGDTAKVNVLSESIAYAQDRTSVLDFEGNRMATAQNAIGSARAQTEETLSALRLSPDANVVFETATEAALSGLNDTVSRLNGSFGGRPLFGGDSGLSPLGSAEDLLTAVRDIFNAAPDAATALAETEAWFNDPAGGFQTTFYQGGDGNAPTVEIDRGERVTTSVRADDQAFRDLLRGFAVTALAGETGSDTGRDLVLAAGETILSGANDSAIQVQSVLGVREERVATALADHSAQVTTLGIAFNGLTGRDQAEAATEMRLLESQLEAAYLTTSRMSNLSLLNFLR